MKHAVSRSKATVKLKTKPPTQTKTVKKMKPAVKISTIKPASKPNGKIKVEKSKIATKPAVKKVAPQLSTKTLNALKTLSARNVKPVAKKIEKIVVKKATAKKLSQKIKTAAPQPKPISRAKKTAPVEKKAKKIVTAPTKTKLKTTAKPKAAVKKIAAKVKPAEAQIKKTPVRTAKPRPTKVEKIAPVKRKFPLQKKKSTAAPKKSKVSEKTQTTAAASKKIVKISKPKSKPIAKKVEAKKAAPKISAKTANRQRIQPKQPAAKIKQPIAAKTVENKLPVAAKKVVRQTPKLKPAIAVKQAKKPLPKIKKPESAKKIKLIEKPIEIIVEARPAKPKNKKARPISSAVFRGVKERYDFKVFALNEKLESIPAVYIISKRKIDRRKKGHHALVCIGQTDSIADELKRHRKGKCVKKHQANAISILPETDAQTRLKIETDLKAAHAVACNFE